MALNLTKRIFHSYQSYFQTRIYPWPGTYLCKNNLFQFNVFLTQWMCVYI